MKTLSVAEIKPFIRYAQQLVISNSLQFRSIAAYDCRFFFVRDGVGEIIVNETSYSMEKGCLMLWQPGLEYSLLAKENCEMKLIGFNFDFCDLHRDKQIPIPPSNISEFRHNEILTPFIVSDSDLFKTPVYQQNRHNLELELMQIYKEYKNRLRFYENKISGMFLSILTDILRSGEQSGSTGKQEENINKILRLIKDRYSEPLTNQTIGTELGYHPNYVNHLMVQHTGVSLHKYLQSYRIGRAMDLLQTTELPISQICDAVGFKDFTHFSKYFKRKTGYTPSAFRSGR